MDEICAFLFPVLVGNGKKRIKDPGQIGLRSLKTKEFDHGVVTARYAVMGAH